MEPELREDVLDVHLNGPRGDAELRGDLAGRQALGQALEDLTLPGRKHHEAIGRRTEAVHDRGKVSIGKDELARGGPTEGSPEP